MIDREMVIVDEAHRLLARAFDDIELYRRLLALMPWTVHCNHHQRRARERATRLLALSPQGQGGNPWPMS